MDSKSGTRIDNSLRYCVLFSNYGDPGHAMFVAYKIHFGTSSTRPEDFRDKLYGLGFGLSPHYYSKLDGFLQDTKSGGP